MDFNDFFSISFEKNLSKFKIHPFIILIIFLLGIKTFKGVSESKKQRWFSLLVLIKTKIIIIVCCRKWILTNFFNKDINSLSAPSHFGCMFAKLSEVQLSNLVIKLLSTICSVEIRWKSRQRRIRSPSVTPSTLYVMSYPLVQFASDSLNSLRNNSVNSQLR